MGLGLRWATEDTWLGLWEIFQLQAQADFKCSDGMLVRVLSYLREIEPPNLKAV